jgi:uncharacterized OsmC-like protein
VNDPNIRRYDVRAQSTDTFGRVLCACRNHHFVSDGPIQNGCPGEAITPAELFLTGVAACGVELVQVISRERGIPLRAVHVDASGVMDRSHPVRPDVSLFNSVRFEFTLAGVNDDQARELITAFKGR